MDTFRKYRNELLANTDWTQSNDSPLSEEKKKEWATYRQELRDITKTAKPKFNDGWDFDSSSVTFPTKPS